MRRSLALTSAVCLLAVAGCTTGSADPDGPAETVEELTEEGLTGLALLHRGFEGGDPETEQVLVFHDPETGQPVHRIALPEGAVDPMAPDLPVHAQFSEDWQYFVYAATDPSAIHIAALTDPEDAAAGEEEAEGEDAEAVSYQPVETIPASPDEVLSRPVVHGERLWFVSDLTQDGQPPQVMSVPLDAPGGTPNQEGTLALGEKQRPSDWALTPDGSLHIRNSVPTTQLNGAAGESLVVRETDGSVVNATLNVAGTQWQTFGATEVWGDGTAVLRPDPALPEQAQAGAYLVAMDGQSHTTTRLLETSDGPVLQYAPAPERDAVLLQTEEAWFRVDLEEGEATETTELFPRFHDASMDGYPLAVRWAQETPETDPGEEASESS
ncbi:hypothetical protein [Nocardiopsis sp. NRRL B-16309]|uniref:hypothetical protein n=1 Tax=Nocardiopsis sp. NRRL B-16309 TaxID=1519494 RepID=UPI0006AE8A08|nr:hypothetical protein [Nocardiopsis sp. NRRL B-16309]KOX11230.1 hypothetical protein ADL05_23585 [Nocardiopsis sp. NRRL B-16309]